MEYLWANSCPWKFYVLKNSKKNLELVIWSQCDYLNRATWCQRSQERVLIVFRVKINNNNLPPKMGSVESRQCRGAGSIQIQVKQTFTFCFHFSIQCLCLLFLQELLWFEIQISCRYMVWMLQPYWSVYKIIAA